MDTSSEEEEEEEESAPDMKTMTSGGGDLPQEFWQVAPRLLMGQSALECNELLYCTQYFVSRSRSWCGT